MLKKNYYPRILQAIVDRGVVSPVLRLAVKRILALIQEPEAEEDIDKGRVCQLSGVKSYISDISLKDIDPYWEDQEKNKELFGYDVYEVLDGLEFDSGFWGKKPQPTTQEDSPEEKHKKTPRELVLDEEVLLFFYERHWDGILAYDHYWRAQPLGTASYGYKDFMENWSWFLNPTGITSPMTDEKGEDRLEIPQARASVESGPMLRYEYVVKLAKHHGLTVIQEYDKVRTCGKGKDKFDERKIALWVGKPELFPEWLTVQGKWLTEEPKPEPEPTVKEAWQMTQKEYINDLTTPLSGCSQLEALPSTEAIKSIINWHKSSIQQALVEGKPVPPEVLTDYPDLVPEPTPLSIADLKPGDILVYNCAQFPVTWLVKILRVNPEFNKAEGVKVPLFDLNETYDTPFTIWHHELYQYTWHKKAGRVTQGDRPQVKPERVPPAKQADLFASIAA